MDNETGDAQDATLSADEQKAATEQSDPSKPEGEQPEGEVGKTEKAEGDKEGEKPDDTDEDDQDEPKARKRLTGAAKWKARALEAQARLAELESRQPRGDGEKPATEQRQDVISQAEIEAEIGKPPQEKDFADWFAFQTALNEYAAEKAVVKRELRARKAEQQSRAREDWADQVEEFNANARDVAKKLPDYKDVVGKSDVRLSRTAEALIVESEKGPLILYHLAKNPERAEALNRMSPVAAAKEIGRLETRLSLPTATKATKAGTPESSLKGGAAHQKNPSDMTMDEFVRWREAEEKAAAKR